MFKKAPRFWLCDAHLSKTKATVLFQCNAQDRHGITLDSLTPTEHKWYENNLHSYRQWNASRYKHNLLETIPQYCRTCQDLQGDYLPTPLTSTCYNLSKLLTLVFLSQDKVIITMKT